MSVRFVRPVMMSLLLLASMLGAAGVASAEQDTVFEFRGYRIGMSVAEVAANVRRNGDRPTYVYYLPGRDPWRGAEADSGAPVIYDERVNNLDLDLRDSVIGSVDGGGGRRDVVVGLSIYFVFDRICRMTITTKEMDDLDDVRDFFRIALPMAATFFADPGISDDELLSIVNRRPKDRLVDYEGVPVATLKGARAIVGSGPDIPWTVQMSFFATKTAPVDSADGDRKLIAYLDHVHIERAELDRWNAYFDSEYARVGQ